EVGINDWITGAVQWAPGYNVYSKIDGMDKATLADAADLFVGAKLQIVGPKAPVQNETFRFAVAPGVKIPLSSPDWVTEATNAGTGKDFLAGGADKHTFGFGGRGYFDYVINEMFFLNLYTQFIYYPLAVDFKNANITAAGTWATIHAGDSTYNPTIMYGYDLTLEFEPHFNTMISDGLELEAGVPVTYTMSPKEDVSGDTYAAYTPNPDTNLLTVGPNVSLFFQKTFLPIEVKVGYTLPLMGKNTESVNTLLLELKVYAKY
ncbi:MAG TPA: hypothetical protein VMC79_15230, partial [Rectinemataceae bacterium]|nr:hypothetical protein [Rectinemataceae bacterium]